MKLLKILLLLEILIFPNFSFAQFICNGGFELPTSGSYPNQHSQFENFVKCWKDRYNAAGGNDYQSLIPLLIKAMQEQQAQIDSLKVLIKK